MDVSIMPEYDVPENFTHILVLCYVLVFNVPPTAKVIWRQVHSF